MSSLKTIGSTIGTVVRKKDDGTGGEGDGKSKRLYAGRFGSAGTPRNYTSFLKFAVGATDTSFWAGVGQIVSATLIVYTDDQNGIIMGPPAAADVPHFVVKRLKDPFTEGNNADGVFNSSDYTGAFGTTDSAKAFNAAKAPGALNRIDITGMMEDWAPATVKRRDGKPGGKVANYGLGIYGSTNTTQNWSGWSEDHTPAGEQPTIELVYQLGHTVPNAPGNLTPNGLVTSIGSFQADFSDVRASDKLTFAEVQVFSANHAATGAASNERITSANHGLKFGDVIYFTSLTGGTGLSTFTLYYVRVVIDKNVFTVSTTKTAASTNILTDYSGMTWAVLVWSSGKTPSSNTDTVTGRTHLIPSNFIHKPNTNYNFRIRQWDQESQVSPWSGLSIFSESNTDPNAPTLSPVSGTSKASLAGVHFKGGTFTDPNGGDRLAAYQVQLSAYPSGDVHWLDADSVLWDTGKVYTESGATSWDTLYGGAALVAGTYYWRARQFDQKDGVSAWTYATIILTADFDIQPGTQDTPQFDPKAPWRIVIRGMHSNGLRGPGAVVAILDNAKSPGASKVYNSPGEIHFTLPIDHPQIAVIEPHQTHYSLQFYTGDGWREHFAGLVTDYDATETGAIFLGVDYLGLLDGVMDERYDASAPDKTSAAGGSKYVNMTLSAIISDHLTRMIALPNSPVGFMTVGSLATMAEKTTIWSTMAPSLPFVTGLIDSHRQGTGKKTRISVKRTTTGAYQIVVEDDPGVIRENLRLRYGELVQGYRIIPFGTAWFTHVNVVGRTREGIKVYYKSGTTGDAPGISQPIYGRFSTAQIMDGIADENDLIRRQKQAAIHAGKLGKSVALGIRSGFLAPFGGYDVCDIFPLTVQHGVVDTTRFGSGYWVNYAVAWEAGDNGEQSTNITFLPREDTTAPDADLIPSKAYHIQDEWTIAFSSPDPAESSIADGFIWVDEATGHINRWSADLQAWVDLTDTLDNSPRVLASQTIVSTDFGEPLPGGHNVILNSGFELGAYPTTGSVAKTYDVALDFSTQHVRGTTNITEGTSLTLTGSTY